MGKSDTKMMELCSHIERIFVAIDESLKKGRFTTANFGLDHIEEIDKMAEDNLQSQDYYILKGSIKNGINFIKHKYKDTYIPDDITNKLDEVYL